MSSVTSGGGGGGGSGDSDSRSASQKRPPSDTPPSSEKETKRQQLSSDDLDRLVCEARGMNQSINGTPVRPVRPARRDDHKGRVDTTSIHETILTRVNQAVAMANLSGGGEAETMLVRVVVPALVTAVSVAVSEAMSHMFKERDREIPDLSHLHHTIERLQANGLRQKYECDALQQYSRRETVRIFGIPEQASRGGGEETEGEGEQDQQGATGGRGAPEEDLEAKVLGVFKDCGADIKPQDISTMHRTGARRRGGGRPVLVRFVSRKHHREIMSKKKELKDKPGYGKVFINEDLTSLRAKLLKFTKDLPMVGRAWTSNGKILAARKLPPGADPKHPSARPVSIESPDDLFKLGVTDLQFEDYKALGLEHLVVF